MALGDVVDMDDVEAGIDEGRHAARRRLDDHPSGRRRLHVARADRRRGIDDDGRQPGAGQLAHHLLGEELGALVVAQHGGDAAGRGLVGGAAVAAKAERRDAAGIDDALDPGRGCGPHQAARAVDIGAIERRRIAHPEAVVGRDVEQPAAAPSGREIGGGTDSSQML